MSEQVICWRCQQPVPRDEAVENIMGEPECPDHDMFEDEAPEVDQPPEDPWDREDDAWIQGQKKRATATAILYPWVRDAVDTTGAHVADDLRWVGAFGGSGTERKIQNMYSTKKMINMVMVATVEPHAFRDLVDNHTTEELESMLYHVTFERHHEREEERDQVDEG